MNTKKGNKIVEFTKELVAMKEIADAVGESLSTVCNWRDRDPIFPAPYERLSSGDVYLADEIAEYLRECKGYRAYPPQKRTKSIFMVGQPDVGKSHSASLFAHDGKGFVQSYCPLGAGERICCPAHITVSRECSEDTVSVHVTDNNLVMKELVEMAEKLNGEPERPLTRENVLYFNALVKEMQEAEMKCNAEAKFKHYSDIHLCITVRPSHVVKKQLMLPCNLKTLVIIDMPADILTNLSDDNKEGYRNKISGADAYVFCLKQDSTDRGREELKAQINNLKYIIGDKKVIFTYNVRYKVTSEEDYEEARQTSRMGVEALGPIFDEFRNESFIFRDTALLNPAEECIPYPGLHKEKVCAGRQLMTKELNEKLSEAFGDRDMKDEERLIELVKEYGDNAKQLVIDLLRNIPKHEIKYTDFIIYDVETNFKAAEHWRTTKQDKYRLENHTIRARGEELSKLNEYFGGLSVEDFPEKWQRDLARAVYAILISAVREKYADGLGEDIHERRPLVMHVCESLLADRIYEAVTVCKPGEETDEYRRVLKEYGVQSNSWDRVYCGMGCGVWSEWDKRALLKLKLTDELIIRRNIKVAFEWDAILLRHFGGLRMLTVYEIFEELGYEHDEIIKLLEGMPF